MYFKILLCTTLIYSYVTANIIQIKSGLIEGQTLTNVVSGKEYFSFEGIPYAQPPLGKLRFQPPQKPISWTDVKETKTKKSKCVQKTGGSEDCLYLNVFTPKLPNINETNELLPVMFYIHGGVFIHGSSNLYNPEYLIDKNIVLVTINYRLNIFGFLNARSESAQGNAGLKDQVAALQWVHENIEKFNGDPNKITICGHSAGGTSVNYLILSKLAKGLFHRAVMQSGSVLNEFAIYNDPTSIVYKMGELLNCESNNITDIVEFLRNVPSMELFTAAFNTKVIGDHTNRFPPMRWVPSIENDVPGAFITENSFSLLVNNEIANPVPTIIGYTNGEAGFFLKNLKSKIIDLNTYRANPQYLIPESLNISNNTDKTTGAINEILDHFFDNDAKLITNKNFIKYQSQNVFERVIRKTIALMRANMDLYFYKFTYKGEDLPNDYDGVPHAYELKFLFYKFENTTVPPEDNDMILKMVTLWTNFVKFGNPTPDDSLNIVWPKVSKIENNNDTIYLNICKTMKIKKNPNQHCHMFWETLFKNYGIPPFSAW